MVERLAGTEDRKSDAQICNQEDDISQPYANLQVRDASSVGYMSAKNFRQQAVRFHTSIFHKEPSRRLSDTIE